MLVLKLNHVSKRGHSLNLRPLLEVVILGRFCYTGTCLCYEFNIITVIDHLKMSLHFSDNLCSQMCFVVTIVTWMWVRWRALLKVLQSARLSSRWSCAGGTCYRPSCTNHCSVTSHWAVHNYNRWIPKRRRRYCIPKIKWSKYFERL